MSERTLVDFFSPFLCFCPCRFSVFLSIVFPRSLSLSVLGLGLGLGFCLCRSSRLSTFTLLVRVGFCLCRSSRLSSFISLLLASTSSSLPRVAILCLCSHPCLPLFCSRDAAVLTLLSSQCQVSSLRICLPFTSPSLPLTQLHVAELLNP